MPNPDTIVVETIDPIDSIVVSPAPQIDSVTVNTVPSVSDISINTSGGVSTIDVSDDPGTLDVNISISDVVIPVTSVNGKTGAVVIDYPDIGANPVNHVRYLHNQSVMSSEWNIPHNLGYFPNVQVIDNANRNVEAFVQYVDINNARIVMNVAISGVAYLT